MCKVSCHPLILQLNQENQHDWLDMFPGSAVVKQIIGFWGERMGYVSHNHHP